jgi:hypothetical protein
MEQNYRKLSIVYKIYGTQNTYYKVRCISKSRLYKFSQTVACRNILSGGSLATMMLAKDDQP